MGSKKKLSQFEQGRITEMAGAGHTHRAIAKALQRSQAAISRFLKDPDAYNEKNPGGRPQKLSPVAKRTIVRKAKRQPALNANRLSRESPTKVSPQSVRRLLRKESFMFRKRKIAPPLKESHKTARLSFARITMEYGLAGWSNIVFSDEKKFNLDGPDGCQYIWHHPSIPLEAFSHRQNKGGGIMFWGAISAFGPVAASQVSGAINAVKYIQVLEEAKLIGNARRIVGPSFRYMQDNAAVHVAASVKAYFREQEVDLVDWPSCSPDLNPIENVWACMVLDIYKDGKQYSTTAELSKAVWKAWNGLDKQLLMKLYTDLPNRIYKLVYNRGSYVGY